MNTRLLMTASALVLAASGLPLLFAPDLCLPAIGAGFDAAGQLVAQLLGAACFAVGLINWMAKGITLGGIYGRAITMGNLSLFTCSALVLLKMHAVLSAHPLLWAVAVVHVVFAVLFGLIAFTHPAP